jgi:UDP-N-acetylmuramyl pentapeptide synthase
MNHLLYPVEELAECMDAKAFVQLPEAMVRTVLTDSRRLHDTDKALFFALRDRRDGHVFISEVYDTGVRSFVISDPDFDYGAFIGANFYLVEDTLKALQRLAAFHRKKFNYPVIGITGSNGKTVVKEWLYQLLSPEYTMVRSPKSYNSRLGVPLSVWEMDETNDLAIFEAGISTTGEMDMIAPVIRPTIGILTHIGEAHQEGFRSLSEKISEKLKLFEGVDL